MPSHSHKVQMSIGDRGYSGVDTWQKSTAYNGTTNEVGESQVHNNVPPYFVVYMYKRIS